MTPQQRQRVEELFDRLADETLDQSRSFLDSECADDHAVRSEVLRLLIGSKASSPTADVRRGLERISDSLEAELKVGDRVESYELLEKIASGGMGTVYRARQDLTNQVVALKVIRPGLLSPYLVRRFMFEVEVLGKLEDIGIARIFAAGIATTSLGQQPYFAMEFVHGLPLDEHARKNDLSVRQRLELFHRVAEAMNAAHQRGVVHRDLKPNNILVTDAGQPKVLDFGVARATNVDQPAGPALTIDTDGLVGTVPFMAPEQISGAGDEIDLQTDVYTMGVVGFLLLTDRMPYDLAGKPLHETSRIICDEEPRRPSSIRRALRGDVEAILLKALEKPKARRYQSAGALAEDVRRAIADEPVEARPLSAMRRAGKFGRRHRYIVAAVGAVIVSLAAGLIATAVALRRAERQRVIAESETENARSVLQFFTGNMMGNALPTERGRDVTVVEVVQDAEKQLEGQFTGKPRIEAGIRQSIAQIYNTLGRPKQALPHAQRALELLGPLNEQNATAVLDAQHEIGHAHMQLGNNADCERIWGQEITDRLRLLGADHEDTLKAQNDLATLLATTDRADKAIAIHQEVYERILRTLGPDHPSTITSALNLYGAQEQAHGDGKTVPQIKELKERATRSLGPDHPTTLNMLRVLGVAAANAGDFDEAIQYFRMDWEGCQRAYGPSHVATVTAGANVVAVLYNLHRYEEAAKAARENVEQSTAVFGPTHGTTLLAKTNLAGALARSGHAAEGERIARETLPLRSAAEGEYSDAARGTRRILAICLREQGKFEEAATLFRQDLDWMMSSLGPKHVATIDQAVYLSGALSRLERFDEVVAALEPIAAAALGPDGVEGARRDMVIRNMSEAYRANNQEEKAIELLNRHPLAPTTAPAATTTTAPATGPAASR